MKKTISILIVIMYFSLNVFAKSDLLEEDFIKVSTEISAFTNKLQKDFDQKNEEKIFNIEKETDYLRSQVEFFDKKYPDQKNRLDIYISKN